MGIAIPIIVSLIFGAAGGYTGARFLIPGNDSELGARDARIAELQKTISDLKFDVERANTDPQASISSAVILGLNTQIAALKEDLDKAQSESDALRAALKKAGSSSRAAEDLAMAKEEIAALEKSLEDAGDLAAQLNRANATLRQSDAKLREMDDQNRTQAVKIKALEQALAVKPGNGTPEQAAQIKSLTNDIIRLQAAVEATQSSARSQKAALEDTITALEADKSTLQTAIDRAGQDAARLNKKIGALADDNREKQDGIDSLTQQNKTLAQNVKDLKAELAAASGNGDLVDAIQKKLDAAQKKSAELAGQLAARDKEIAGLQADIAGLNEKLAAATSGNNGQTTNDGTGTENTDVPDTKLDQQAQPRDAAKVERALNRMPGVDRLASDQRDQLQSELENGACVIDALENVYEKVPILALRNLLRDLKSPC